MKVLHLSTSELAGGAAIAASRLNNAMNKCEIKIQSKLRVIYKQTNNPNVIGTTSSFAKFINKVKCKISLNIQKLQKTDNNVLHSISLFSSSILNEINNSDADIVNLHWIQGEMLSIKDIGLIRKPLVWTLHDSWAFSGSEHYPNDLSDRRYIDGYLKNNRNKKSTGIDIDRIIWLRKRRLWKNKISIICPSEWLMNCAKKSSLFKDKNVIKIPNLTPLDTFNPRSKKVSREVFGFSQKSKIILFGALGGTQDLRKGWDLLEIALKELVIKIKNIKVVIFGQERPDIIPNINCPLIYLGKIKDNNELAFLYSSADVMLVPSRIESFCQVASEAQSCGLPVVSFNTTGLKDVVSHKITGYLCEAFNPDSLVDGVCWVLKNKERTNFIRKQASQRAKSLWDEKKIVRQYFNFYKTLLSN